MATRSRIGMVLDDGSVASIYCHWNGYPSNNGRILLDHYTNKEKVASLIALGDISSLAPEVSTDKAHTFDNPVAGVVVAYGRDRGETDVAPRKDASAEDFKKSDIEEYGYLFIDGKWIVADDYAENREWVDLTDDYIKSE